MNKAGPSVIDTLIHFLIPESRMYTAIMSEVAELRSSQKKKHEATETNGAWCVANQAIALYSRDFFGSFFYLEKNEQNFIR